MTKFKEWPDANVDLLVGGTPCQSFSVAGLRKGLDDPRGNLMLTYLAIAGRYRPRWLVWENVPGVLSSNGGRDFGAFLGGLAELGYGFAYRVLDAQYFGVAQRRRRVFVVGYLGDWRRAASVLFERYSLSGHPAPSREAGQGFAGTITSSLGRRAGVPDCTRTPGLIQPLPAEGCWWDGGQVSQTLDAVLAKGQTMPEKNRFPAVLQPVTDAENNCLNPDQPQCWRVYDPTGVSPSLQSGEGRGNAILSKHLIPQQEVIAIQNATRVKSQNGLGIADPDAPMYPLEQASQHAVAFHENQQAQVWETDVMQPLNTGGGKPGQSYPAIRQGMAVRRLTPIECERLQGFPDGYTNVPFRGKPVTDGHRYKALGNSKAVPVVRWIGERIAAVETISN